LVWLLMTAAGVLLLVCAAHCNAND